jgi:ribosome recycling factor
LRLTPGKPANPFQVQVERINEDDDRRAHDEIQKMVDAHIQRLDQAAKTKEKEILELK